MIFRVEVEQEAVGRWIAEVIELSGAMAYGATREEAASKVQALALRVSPTDSTTVKQVPAS